MSEKLIRTVNTEQATAIRNAYAGYARGCSHENWLRVQDEGRVVHYGTERDERFAIGFVSGVLAGIGYYA